MATTKSIDAITLFSEDVAASKAFYADALELELVHGDDASAVFALGGTLLNVLRTENAHGLIAPAAVAPAGTGARAQLTIEVDDVDAACDELTAKGVALLNGPADQPWGRRTAAFADPAGHIWEYAQILDA